MPSRQGLCLFALLLTPFLTPILTLAIVTPARSDSTQFSVPAFRQQPPTYEVGEPKRLEVGAQGKLVEDLQRTLNARLKLSPDLAVDGDFGAATRRAVERFQRARKLPASGVVDAATWKALGDLVTSDPAVAEPDEVNRASLPSKPAESLEGPPLTTCKAWAIADAKTGKLLWGKSEDRELDIASTTKIMTAYLVLRQAAEDPKTLDQQVTFSERADKTNGSSARIRAGEQLAVRELLYGLLLPSGNDASVALAEHFGGQFAPPQNDSTDDKDGDDKNGDDKNGDDKNGDDKGGDDKDGDDKGGDDKGGDDKGGGEPSSGNGNSDPLACFVAEMNRAANELKMASSSFKNPHGLTAKDHRSSARDLVRLAHAAIQVPHFCDYVGTRQHGCRLTASDGSQRNIIWKNTNRLLPIDGYDGIKTGTTSAAGACLVSLGRRGDDPLLVVVLGSANSEARYVDSRNLFRWAWRQRQAAKP